MKKTSNLNLNLKVYFPTMKNITTSVVEAESELVQTFKTRLSKEKKSKFFLEEMEGKTFSFSFCFPFGLYSLKATLLFHGCITVN